MAQPESADAVTDEKQPNSANDDASNIESKTTHGGIILIPQPSSDPRDPLV